MAKVDAAVITARVLKDQGVDCIFGLTGGHIFRFFQECEKVGIRVIDVRHETAAVHAAIAYSRIKRKMAVCCFTAGPGVMSAYEGIVDAQMSNIPMLVLAGASPAWAKGTKAMQEVDQLTPARAAGCKYVASITNNDLLARTLYNAIREANAPARGVSFVEIPVEFVVNDRYAIEDSEGDVYGENMKVSELRFTANSAAVEEAAELLLSTEKGYIYMGDQMPWALKDDGVFKELAEFLQFPINAVGGDLGNYIEQEHPLAQGGLAAGSQAEVMITFGTVADSTCGFMTDGTTANAKCIQVSDNAAQIGFGRAADVALYGTPDVVARQLLDVMKAKAQARKYEDSQFAQQCSQAPAYAWAGLAQGLPELEKSEQLHPMVVTAAVHEFLATEGTECDFITDGGDTAVWNGMTATLQARAQIRPNRFFSPPNLKLGGIGWGNAIATGMAAATGNPTMLITGDGSVGQYLAECYTWAKFGLPVIAVIYNNGDWGMIRSFEMFKEAYDTEDQDVGNMIMTPDKQLFHYEEMAKAWGGAGIYVTKKEEIVPALREAVASAKAGKPAIVNIAMKFVRCDADASMVNPLYD